MPLDDILEDEREGFEAKNWERETALVKCASCGDEKDIDAFTKTQWRKICSEKKNGKCKACIPTHPQEQCAVLTPPVLSVENYPPWPKSLPELPNCAICLGDLSWEKKYLSNCRHVFHYDCISTWIKKNPTCPICRTLVKF